ncbi:MAG: sulfatase-like hydrolase/transferase [Abditibacteriaceae bacterium]
MNIVIVVIDSLRPDHLGCYGYDKNTSPNLDKLAGQSMVFDAAFAPGIPTMPSFTTLLSGLHPYRHGITAHASEQRVDQRVVMLPQVAKANGMTTVGIDNLAVQSSGRGSWFVRGYDYYSGFLFKPFSEQCAELVDRAINFIDDLKENPFFLFLHMWDPHTPYGPPAPYDMLHYKSTFAEATRAKMAEVKALAPEYYEAFLGDMKLAYADDYDYVVAQYDGEISYADAQVGRLMESLETNNLLDETIVIAMSDHGECFGEGEFYFDHHGLYDATTRVALMCHVPGAATGRCAQLVSTQDIFPTLCAQMNWQTPPDISSKHQFAPAFNNQSFNSRDEIILVESSRQASIAIRTPDWKLIVPVTEDIDGNALPDFYGNPRDPKVLLYDLKSDPNETQNVADRNPAQRDQLLQRLQSWRAQEVARLNGHDPLLENGLSLGFDEFMERMLKRGK